MDREEAERVAIAAGALKPQTMAEDSAAGIMAYNGQNWADTPKARARLAEWTQMVMNGETLPSRNQSVGCVLILVGMTASIWGIALS